MQHIKYILQVKSLQTLADSAISDIYKDLELDDIAYLIERVERAAKLRLQEMQYKNKEIAINDNSR